MDEFVRLLTFAEIERQRRELDPSEAQTVEASRAEYWSYLAGLLREREIESDPDVLRALPREVELGERIRARIARAALTAPSPP